MKFLAFIPARGGSKGIHMKNISLLCGRPLISYTIEAAIESNCFSEIIVSTDSDEIYDVARGFDIRVLVRSPMLAGDDTPTLDVIKDIIESKQVCIDHFDAIATLQPTSPLRQPSHIREACRLFELDPGADSLVSCIQLPHIFHPSSLMRLGENGYLTRANADSSKPPTRRQDKEPLYARNGAAIYITRMSMISSFIYGGNCIPYFMSEADSIDIDTAEDISKAEAIIRQRASYRSKE